MTRRTGITWSGSRLTFDETLGILGRAGGEYLAVCHKPVGGVFGCSVLEAVKAGSFIATLPGNADVWFSVNPTAGPTRAHATRGSERHVTRWAAAYLDLDVKPGGFPDQGVATEFIGELSEMLGTFPSVVISSGHGLQPLWPIEDGELDTDAKWRRAYRLSRRLHQLAGCRAQRYSAGLDNVSDLARILRVAGTTNWKDPANPTPVFAVRGGGGPLSIDRIGEVLDEWAPPIGSNQPVPGGVVSPATTWRFASSTCTYVTTMVNSWSRVSDKPRVGRHQWTMSRCVRLAAAHRLGCISQGELDRALTILKSALRHWCQLSSVPRDLAPDEIGDAYRWATTKVETLDDLRIRSELGNHRHPATKTRTQTLVRR